MPSGQFCERRRIPVARLPTNEMLKLPTSARHRVLRRHGTVYNFKMDVITLHESTVRQGARNVANDLHRRWQPWRGIRRGAGAPTAGARAHC